MNEGIQTSTWLDQACRQGVAEMDPRAGGAEEPMRTVAEDAHTRRGLKRSAELPLDDGARGRGEHLDDDVPIVTPIVPHAEQAADAADAL